LVLSAGSGEGEYGLTACQEEVIREQAVGYGARELQDPDEKGKDGQCTIFVLVGQQRSDMGNNTRQFPGECGTGAFGFPHDFSRQGSGGTPLSPIFPVGGAEIKIRQGLDIGGSCLEMVQSILKTFTDDRLDESLLGAKMTVKTTMGETGVFHQRGDADTGKSIATKALGCDGEDMTMGSFLVFLVVSHGRKSLNYSHHTIA